MKIIVAVFLTFALLVGVASAEKMVYGIPMTIAAGMSYVADAKGFWKDAGADVELKFFASGRQAIDSLLGKSSQICSMAETPPMHAVVQGHKLFWVATVSDHKEVRVTVNTARGIKIGPDLKGKKVATLPGTNSDYYMYKFLEYYGINPKEVKIISMTPPNAATAFVAGDIDAYFSWEPHNYNGASRVSTAATFPVDGDLYRGRHSIMMNQFWVKKNPKDVENLIRGYLLAEKFMAENPDEAKDIVSKIIKIPRGTLDALWFEFDFRVHLDQGLLDLLTKQGNWAIKIKKLDKPAPDWKAHIYTSAMEKVDPARVEFK